VIYVPEDVGKLLINRKVAENILEWYYGYANSTK
jgi:hypothetical protein